MKCKPWEVWWADVKFEEDKTKVKRRPVIILEDRKIFAVCVKTTSQRAREGEFDLQYYQYANLPKPTVVRISHILHLKETDLISKIGDLHPYDITMIRFHL